MQGEVKGEYKGWEDQLLKEGFEGLYTQTDEANKFYPLHKHEDLTAHIILSGEMQLTVFGETKVLHPGDRYDVPAFAEHSARIGKDGCKYIVGVKSAEEFG